MTCKIIGLSVLLLLGGCGVITQPAPLRAGGATIAIGAMLPDAGRRFLSPLFKIQSPVGTTANVHHYTYKLYTYPAHVLQATYTSTGLTGAFTTVPDGTYDMTAEAFFSTDDTVSATKFGPQASTNQVTVASPIVSYTAGSALTTTLDLVDGTGSTINNTLAVGYLGNAVTPNHYTYKLYASPANVLLDTHTSSNTSTAYTNVPDGTYKMTVEGFSSADDSVSITYGGAQSSNVVTVTGATAALTASPTLFLNTWTAAPKANLPTLRSAVSAVVADTIYAIGGRVSGAVWSNKNEAYVPATNTWTAKADMPTARDQLAVVALNGLVYAVGGGLPLPSPGPTTVHEVYDPVANTWTTKAPMPTARYAVGGAALNGKLYVVGGFNGTFLATTQRYDPVTDTWTACANMNTPPRAYLAVAAAAGKLYAIGGNTGNYSNKTEMYDPATNTWTTMADMPTPRWGVTAAVVNDRIYCIGGITTGAVYTNVVEMYDPATNTWTPRAAMPTVRTTNASAVNNRIYAIGGGLPTTAITNKVEEYNP